MKEIDCRGLACPAPVITVKKQLEESAGTPFRILLDNGAARENVLRFISSQGCTAIEEPCGTSTLLIISGSLQPAATLPVSEQQAPSVILIASDRMGNGSDELGRLLLRNFIFTLLELQALPAKIIFLNSGVLLTTEGSELIAPLSKLSNDGVEILSCGVCLNYYGVSEKLMVGMVGNMYTIAESLLATGNAIRL